MFLTWGPRWLRPQTVAGTLCRHLGALGDSILGELVQRLPEPAGHPRSCEPESAMTERPRKQLEVFIWRNILVPIAIQKKRFPSVRNEPASDDQPLLAQKHQNDSGCFEHNKRPNPGRFDRLDDRN